jgi:hypothetical protein
MRAASDDQLFNANTRISVDLCIKIDRSAFVRRSRSISKILIGSVLRFGHSGRSVSDKPMLLNWPGFCTEARPGTAPFAAPARYDIVDAR